MCTYCLLQSEVYMHIQMCAFSSVYTCVTYTSTYIPESWMPCIYPISLPSLSSASFPWSAQRYPKYPGVPSLCLCALWTSPVYRFEFHGWL